jgi:hypothetical protein
MLAQVAAVLKRLELAEQVVLAAAAQVVLE